MLLKLYTTHRALNVIQPYSPTNDKADAELEEFYYRLEDAIHLTKKGRKVQSLANTLWMREIVPVNVD